MRALFPRLVEKAQRWSFNGELGKDLSGLFDVQMWCFGCDIRRPEGNLLMASGFARQRSEQVVGSSRYVATIGDRYEINLWGFAAIVREGGSAVGMRRHGHMPLYSSAASDLPVLHRPHDLPRFTIPKDPAESARGLILLRVMAQALARYEQFVEQNSAATYRARCKRLYRSQRDFRAKSLASAWNELADGLREVTPTRGS
jgi:hypothetical protein